jgi:hypothetical protein
MSDALLPGLTSSTPYAGSFCYHGYAQRFERLEEESPACRIVADAELHMVEHDFTWFALRGSRADALVRVDEAPFQNRYTAAARIDLRSPTPPSSNT